MMSRHAHGRHAWPSIVGMLVGWGLAAAAPAGVTPPAGAAEQAAVVLPEPPVSRPASTPCTVTLLDHVAFDERGDAASMDARPRLFAYAPPVACHARGGAGGWGKVVLEADFQVPAGRQYDRTVALWLGGINLYFGTTLEPSPGQGRSWHVERDLSDYAALFAQPHEGQVILNNWISPTTGSPIILSVRLRLYPRTAKQAAHAADRVYALSSDPRGAQTALDNPAETLSRSFTFPRNVERAYLDVIAQSQAHDERWYTCVDQAYLERTRAYSLESFEACDGGSHRGVAVAIDGQPAGLAPVQPWIYTGGVAPHLWLPTPDMQSTSFIPFRIDLTPFAGLLDDGQPHQVSVRVAGADHFFNVAANLLVYLDHGATRLQGEVLRNTLDGQPAAQVVRDTLHAGSHGASEGTLDTTLEQHYLIRGRLRSSHGTIVTVVRYRSRFRNHQTFRQPADNRYLQTIDQSSRVSMVVQRSRDGHALDGYTLRQDDPLYLSVDKSMAGSGQDFTAQVRLRRGHRIDRQQTDARGQAYHATLEENIASRVLADGPHIPDPLDRSSFDHQQQGHATTSFTDALGSCYRVALVSRDEKLVTRTTGEGCPGQANRLDPRSRPDNPALAPL